jgi:hypothetical protein
MDRPASRDASVLMASLRRYAIALASVADLSLVKTPWASNSASIPPAAAFGR